MKLDLQRVTLFCKDVPAQARFYREVLGLSELISPDDETVFVEFEAGGCRIALHSGGPPSPSKRLPKLVFYAQDVEATRAWLVFRGAKMGKVKRTGLELADGSELSLCEGKDLEGNPFQLSNRY